MVHLIPKHARINDLLSLRTLIEHAREELVAAKHELDDIERQLHIARLRVGAATAGFESIVAIYNRLVVEYEPQERKPR